MNWGVTEDWEMFMAAVVTGLLLPKEKKKEGRRERRGAKGVQ